LHTPKAKYNTQLHLNLNGQKISQHRQLHPFALYKSRGPAHTSINHCSLQPSKILLEKLLTKKTSCMKTVFLDFHCPWVQINMLFS